MIGWNININISFCLFFFLNSVCKCPYFFLSLLRSKVLFSGHTEMCVFVCVLMMNLLCEIISIWSSCVCVKNNTTHTHNNNIPAPIDVKTWKLMTLTAILLLFLLLFYIYSWAVFGGWQKEFGRLCCCCCLLLVWCTIFVWHE